MQKEISIGEAKKEAWSLIGRKVYVIEWENFKVAEYTIRTVASWPLILQMDFMLESQERTGYFRLPMEYESLEYELEKQGIHFIKEDAMRDLARTMSEHIEDIYRELNKKSS